MPGTFAYDAGTNTVTVTGGTSGSPADLASFVAADRAGAGTSLLAAHAPANTLALTYQVRPVELLALLISFVVAGKTAETDYIFVTGTDAWGAAQTESLDVGAGNGTYVSAKRWRTITNMDCSDNPAGGGMVWANGTVTVTQPQWGVIWNKGNGQYQLDCAYYVGNGTTSTYFFTSLEQVRLTIHEINVYANATFVSGVVTNLASKRTYAGSAFLGTGPTSAAGGVVYLYSSLIQNLTGLTRVLQFDRIWNCSLQNDARIGGATQDVFNTQVEKAQSGIWTASSITVANARVLDYIYSGIYKQDSGTATLTGCVFRSANGYYISVFSLKGDVLLIDCEVDNWAVEDQGGSHTKDIYRQYSLNLHLMTPSGANLAGAVVELKDINGSTVFSVTTGTDGKIAQQTVTRIKYNHANSWAAVDYGPHTLTITADGYQDYQDVITIDRKMDLEVAMLGAAGGVSPINMGLVPLGIKQVAA